MLLFTVAKICCHGFGGGRPGWLFELLGRVADAPAALLAHGFSSLMPLPLAASVEPLFDVAGAVANAV